MTTTNTAAAAPAPATKPVVTAGANETFSVRFPCGATVEIYPVMDRGQPSGYSFHGVKADGTEVSHLGYRPSTSEEAFAMAWCAVVSAPAPIMQASAVHKLALDCNYDTNAFTAALKKILFARTGIRFSVRAGRGTGSSWVRISTGTKGAHSFTLAERVALAAVFQSEKGRDSISIRPCGNNRVWFVCQAAGHEMPEGVTVRAADWD